jgi:threonine/homoserine/homoserine lactone efflux protein
VSHFSLALLVGALAGFFGAIPPGPLNITILRKTLHGGSRDAFRVALGGAAVDALLCGLIGLGFGWFLERVVTNKWIKAPLALFLVAYGLKVLFWDARRDAQALADRENGDSGSTRAEARSAGRFSLSVLTGLLQGAANPTLFVTWTLLISFLVGHRLLETGPAPAAGFALGVGLGVFGWFALLIALVKKQLMGLAVGVWMRRSTLLAGALLLLFGLFFSYRSITGG